MMSVERAVDHLESCIRRKPICYTAPRFAILLIATVNVAGRLQDVIWKARRRLRG